MIIVSDQKINIPLNQIVSISKYANIDTDSIIIYNLGNTKKVSKIEIGKMRYLSILDSRYLII